MNVYSRFGDNQHMSFKYSKNAGPTPLAKTLTGLIHSNIMKEPTTKHHEQQQKTTSALDQDCSSVQIQLKKYTCLLNPHCRRNRYTKAAVYEVRKLSFRAALRHATVCLSSTQQKRKYFPEIGNERMIYNSYKLISQF